LAEIARHGRSVLEKNMLVSQTILKFNKNARGVNNDTFVPYIPGCWGRDIFLDGKIWIADTDCGCTCRIFDTFYYANNMGYPNW